MQPLDDILQLLTRPIEYASRDEPASLSAAKDLGSFVTRQIVHALSAGVYSPRIETDLLALRQLFSDYHEHLTIVERGRRLSEARRILERLRTSQGEGLEVRGKGASDRFRVPCSRLPGTSPASITQSSVLSPQSSSPQSSSASSPLASGPLPPAQDLWTVPIRFAKGVGPKRADLLEKLSVRSVEDALWYLPWRYEDRSVLTPVVGLQAGSRATICGRILDSRLKRIGRRGLTILEVVVGDETGSIPCVYFNQPYLEKLLTTGTRVMVSGVVGSGRWGRRGLRMEAPQYELLGDESEALLHVGRIVPIYHETKGLTSRQLRTVMKGLLDEYGHGLKELIPPDVLARQGLPTLRQALADVHFPPGSTDLPSLERGTTTAHRRLAFEEFFVLEMALGLRQRSVQKDAQGFRFSVETPLLARLQAQVPFDLTEAQRRVVSEIVGDMRSSRPMNRLIQGDVGCGKTIVALHAIVIACGSNYQAALMAPTEILAEQHYLNLRDLLSSMGLNSVLLKSGAAARARAGAIQAISSGDAHVVIGTHALLQKNVPFARLGLAVIDEQHKFGVLQRKTLLEKGQHPDVLVLTATPIPRTLAMTVYGDLDVAIIDMLPPGRKPIRTMRFTESQRRRAYRILCDELRAGRQAYIVYPLVEESEKTDLQAALQAAERLQAEELREFRVGVLHGRLKTGEKERTMAAFKVGEIQVLVATTVVEVGVDVANATVMLIEHAERFGLAQLHQLRGRIGRGSHQSSCLLLYTSRRAIADPATRVSSARQRLEALVKSADGFVIAEEDLRIRGPGEFFGVRQWGLPEFRAANLVRDGAILEQARRDAFALLAKDPELTAAQHQPLRNAVFRRWREKLALGSVS